MRKRSWEADVWEEENRNEGVIDDLIDISDEDIGIVLQNWKFLFEDFKEC